MYCTLEDASIALKIIIIIEKSPILRNKDLDTSRSPAVKTNHPKSMILLEKFK